MNKIYQWIDRVWQWIAETVFVRFDFDLPLEKLREMEKNSHITFAMTHVGIIEYFILSSWCRSQGLGAILIANRKRILFLSKPLMFLQVLFRRKTYEDLFLSDEPGPRLLFCPTSERKKLFEPVPVETLLGGIYSQVSAKPTQKPFHFFPVFILWRKHVRGAARKPSEYLFGLGSSPNLIGKIWYLARKRRDSLVRVLGDFAMLSSAEGVDTLGETEAMRMAKNTRRKIIVMVQQEMRVILGPRYASPHSVKETLLKDPDIQRAIDEVARTENLDRKKVMSRAYADLTEIVSNYRYRSIEIVYVILTWVFTKVFDGVNAREDELHRLRDTMRTKPVVFVSCHRSHLDYLVIPYVLFLHDIVTPHIAAGINLAFWPTGSFLRSCGAFFIRRSFRGNLLYSTCLKKYVEYLLKNKYNFKFFIEGTRSRSGKMLAPAYGMLKMTLEAQRNKVFEDVALVPVSICYDEVPEQGAYSKELGGGQKIKENAKELFKSRQIIKRNIGKVYVRLSPPISARDVLRTADEAGWDSKLMLQKTAFQLCKNINDATPITPKSIVSGVFLGHRMASVSLEEILRLSQTMAEYSDMAGFPLSVDLNTDFKRSVEQTVRRLGKSGVVALSESSVPRAYTCDRRKRSVLNFYKNNSMHCFVSPSIMMLAFFVNMRKASPTDSAVKIYDDFAKTALELRNILKFEFFFSPTNQFMNEMQMSINYFFGDEPWDRRLLPGLIQSLEARFKGWDDVSLYMRLVGDLIESYLTVLQFIKNNSEFPAERKVLLQKIVKWAEQRNLQGGIIFPESISTQNYSNALMLFENLKLLRIEAEGEKKVVHVGNWSAELQAQTDLLSGYLETMEENLGTLLTQRGFLTSEPPSSQFFGATFPG